MDRNSEPAARARSEGGGTLSRQDSNNTEPVRRSAGYADVWMDGREQALPPDGIPTPQEMFPSGPQGRYTSAHSSGGLAPDRRYPSPERHAYDQHLQYSSNYKPRQSEPSQLPENRGSKSVHSAPSRILDSKGNRDPHNPSSYGNPVYFNQGTSTSNSNGRYPPANSRTPISNNPNNSHSEGFSNTHHSNPMSGSPLTARVRSQGTNMQQYYSSNNSGNSQSFMTSTPANSSQPPGPAYGTHGGNSRGSYSVRDPSPRQQYNDGYGSSHQGYQSSQRYAGQRPASYGETASRDYGNTSYRGNQRSSYDYNDPSPRQVDPNPHSDSSRRLDPPTFDLSLRSPSHPTASYAGPSPSSSGYSGSHSLQSGAHSTHSPQQYHDSSPRGQYREPSYHPVPAGSTQYHSRGAPPQPHNSHQYNRPPAYSTGNSQAAERRYPTQSSTPGVRQSQGRSPATYMRPPHMANYRSDLVTEL